MKRVPSGGYTIIEVMIFLLISSALLSSVMLMVSGKQERTRFTQSAESFNQVIKDKLNDVSTGYYPTAENFRCQYDDSSGVNFTAGAVEQGTNVQSKTSGCIFLGKAIKLGPVPTANFKVYTMVASRNATSLSDARTKLLGLGSNPGVVDDNNLLADVEIAKVVSKSGNPGVVTGLAIVSEFSVTSALNNSVSGNAARVAYYEVMDNFEGNAGKAPPLMLPATQGTLLCLQQGNGGRKATLQIGGNNQQQATELKIDNWPSECVS